MSTSTSTVVLAKIFSNNTSKATCVKYLNSISTFVFSMLRKVRYSCSELISVRRIVFDPGKHDVVEKIYKEKTI
jgi:hypothetical protein